MVNIKEKSIEEIRKRAKDYLTTVRGKKLSRTDILIAENLTEIGYKIAQTEIMEKKEEKKRRKKEAKQLRREISHGRRINNLA
jgi:hypothetical protein